MNEMLLTLVWSFMPPAVACSGFAHASSYLAGPVTMVPTVRTLKKGRIQLRLGKLRRTIDLHNDISGCFTSIELLFPESLGWRGDTDKFIPLRMNKGSLLVRSVLYEQNERVMRVMYRHAKPETGLVIFGELTQNISH